MKKRKTYEISVIDKTYSKTISDETKFYTSDTALELEFKLKETEYTFESAEIVLLNIDDRSLVTRPVSKVNNDFVYELDDDIITHYGDWRGQLRFEQAGEVYVSSPVKFRIENDLSNDRPPQLSDVQSWVSLKRYADGLVDELKQAVLEVEGMDGTFNANELERQDKFETAEQSRQDTFEDAESERAETFNANETTRQAQELERDKAEGQRQSVFDNNEVNRAETFNANEATRQENEEARELAENERENAEAQRKIDHANRSAELAGKADKVVIKNFIENGDVESSYAFKIPSYINFLKTGEIVGPLNYSNTQSIIPAVSGHEYYVRAVFSQGTVRERLYFIYEDNSANFNDGTLIETDMFSGIITAVKTANANLRMYGSAGEKTKKSIMMIDLTEAFGEGNEPTKEEMDELIKVTGYIDGEYALNNKDMLGHLMKGIREKANKKQEDWITVPLFNGAQHGKSPLKVMKDEMGFVHFKGSLTNLVTGSKVFGLPIGYRPDIGATEANIRLAVALSSGRETNVVQINYIGDGYVVNPFDTTVAFFDGVSYLAKRG